MPRSRRRRRRRSAPVTVIGITPLPGLDLPRDRVPAPVQTATGAELEKSGALSLGDFMNRRFGSVHVNEIQGNPFQPDVSYRGYTASPLLGTPQGLSVYADGIRLNQPFGDVVSWDLLPRSAIASIALMPGSNPLFGLNTLGGALSVQTKDGWTHPGTSLQLTAGSHGRGPARGRERRQRRARTGLVRHRQRLSRRRLARRVAIAPEPGVRARSAGARAARRRR